MPSTHVPDPPHPPRRLDFVMQGYRFVFLFMATKRQTFQGYNLGLSRLNLSLTLMLHTKACVREKTMDDLLQKNNKKNNQEKCIDSFDLITL